MKFVTASSEKTTIIHAMHDRAALPEELLRFPGMQWNLKNRHLDAGYEKVDSILRHKITDTTPVGREPRKNAKSRYSDGTFSVFYTSECADTSFTEVAFYRRKTLLGMLERNERNGEQSTINPSGKYIKLTISFSGKIKDYFLCEEDCEKLIRSDEDGYNFCGNLGRQDFDSGDVDALRVPSARAAGSSCIPVFRRSAISRIEDVSPVDLEIDLVSPRVVVRDDAGSRCLEILEN